MALAAALLSCAAGGPLLPDPGAGSPRPVLLVTVSGLTPTAWRGDAAPMPTLAALAAAGVVADEVRTVTPASVYPAHATLVTGWSPSGHGIAADHLLGDRGVRTARYAHASLLRAPTLWQRAVEARLAVATLDWPSSLGAEIPGLLPDVAPQRRGETWLSLLADGATAQALASAERHGGDSPDADRPGPARDAVLVSVACDMLTSPSPPRLLLLRLSQTATALSAHGPGSAQARAAFAGADHEIGRLVACLERSDRLAGAALMVVGDHGSAPVHTALAPNVLLAEARLVTTEGAETSSWRAIARSNGGSAFVYARNDRSALQARRLLAAEAVRTRAFRIVSAEEMLANGGDPEAWFGLEALPGYVFADAATGPRERASARRGAGGYLAGREGMSVGLVAWGRGLRRAVRIPAMQQTDVAPTLARLLGLDFGEVAGRVLVGALGEAPPPVAAEVYRSRGVANEDRTPGAGR